MRKPDDLRAGGAAEERAGRVLDRLGHGGRVGHDRAARRDGADRGAEDGPADAVEDDVVLARPRGRVSTTSSAPSSRRPLLAARERGDVGAGVPWPAGSRSGPTPPDAPVTRTRRPSGLPPMSSVLSAVMPATGSVAACSNETFSGSSASQSVGTLASCAQAPRPIRPTTRAPSFGPLPSAAACADDAGDVPARQLAVAACSPGARSRRGSG